MHFDYMFHPDKASIHFIKLPLDCRNFLDVLKDSLQLISQNFTEYESPLIITQALHSRTILGLATQ